MPPHREPLPDLPPLPLGWRLWFGACALAALALSAATVWAIYGLVVAAEHVAR